jgi:hypothetical protein
MKTVYTSAMFRSVRDEPRVSCPDSFNPSLGLPSPAFVLCSDQNGKATAIYGEDIWEFKPYALTAGRSTKMKFPKNWRFSDEIKQLMFILIYFSNAGRYGKLSVITLINYHRALRVAAYYCESLEHNELVGQISLKQLFTNQTYLAGLSLYLNNDGEVIAKILPAILNHLSSIGADTVGYVPIKERFFARTLKKTNQHPIIPAKIYISLINQFDQYIDTFSPVGHNLEKFIKCFYDPLYGVCHTVQSRKVLKTAKHRPDFSEALSDYGLTEILSGRIYARDRKELFTAIKKIQYVIKCIVHCYTGMRDGEALRIPYDCLSTKATVNKTIDERGVERDPEQLINLLSTTTKLEGYKKNVSWLAPEIVQKAVILGQCLARGLASVYSVSYKDSPLFINSSPRKNVEITPSPFRSSISGSILDMSITKDDLKLLYASDPSREFSKSIFDVDRAWPLTSHQFRRSLAFYATSSGLVSLPSIKKQFKHHSLEMARYYSNGFEHIRSVFGYYDSKKGEFILPGTHSAFEYQLAVPIAITDQIMRDVVCGEEMTFGSTGSQAEKLRKRAKAGEVAIEDIRRETENKARDGEITYRKTLLGGCTYLGKCNSFMLGGIIECLGCTGAVIKLNKINEVIKDLENEVSYYEEGSGEYDLTKYEIGIFVKYRDAIIARGKKGLSNE